MKTDYKAMRNIRVWIKPLRLYLPILMINFERNKVCCGDKESSDWYDFSEVVFEYSTGLYDRNGREIYEGDIVAFGNAIGLEDDYGVIEYKSSRYSFYIENEKTGLWEELFNISYAFLEIIGNIHENPELLEQK